MKPNRPHIVTCSKNFITLGWDPCDSLILKTKDIIPNKLSEEEDENNRRWYVLERKDNVVGWIRAYVGFKTTSEIGPLAPEDFYKFRLKAETRTEESDWSDTLYAATKDDVIPVAQIHRAVENGPVTFLRKTLNQRPTAIDIPNKQGLTPLRLAIHKNNVNFMGILLNQGAEIGNVEPGSGRTPLMVAAQKGLLEAVQLLLERGSSWTTKDRNGLTALNYAIDNSHYPIVELAIEEGVDLKTTDRFGWSPLMRGVVLKSSEKVLKYLLENGSDVNEADKDGQTVLMQAVIFNRPDMVELLVEKGADVERRNIFGRSAYDLAKVSTNEGIQKVTHLLGKEEEEAENGTNKWRTKYPKI